MKIVHHIFLNASPEDQRDLRRLGVKIGSRGYVALNIDDADPRWSALEAWARRRGLPDTPRTEFTSQEVDRADWVELVPAWHHGYPQPERDLAYLGATYDLTDYCAVCGIGARQKAPFRMSGEPRWGRRNVLQLNWVFDEYFVTPQLWNAVFQGFDVAGAEVHGRKGERLQTALQLLNSTGAELDTSGLPSQTCLECRREKLRPVTSGPSPKLAANPPSGSHLIRTTNSFGSERLAYNLVLASQALWRSLTACGATGVTARPVAK